MSTHENGHAMSTHGMNTHDLIEMASLDAMGLLDPDERDGFERAFRAAAPAVQAQIRREQLRFSKVDDMLPQVDPPLGLRARVIAAVREAMQSMAGRRAAEGVPPLRFPTGVSRFWRVGAIGAMAAAIVLGFFSVQVINENRGLTDVRQGDLISVQWQKEFGNRFEAMFLNPNSRFVSFHPAADAPDSRGARATLVLDQVKKNGQLFVKDLPAAGEYEVVIVDAQGRETSASITIKSAGNGVACENIVKFDPENAKKLLIRLQGSTRTILTADGI